MPALRALLPAHPGFPVTPRSLLVPCTAGPLRSPPHRRWCSARSRRNFAKRGRWVSRSLPLVVRRPCTVSALWTARPRRLRTRLRLRYRHIQRTRRAGSTRAPTASSAWSSRIGEPRQRYLRGLSRRLRRRRAGRGLTGPAASRRLETPQTEGLFLRYLVVDHRQIHALGAAEQPEAGVHSERDGVEDHHVD